MTDLRSNRDLLDEAIRIVSAVRGSAEPRQQDLADALGCVQQTVSKMLTGEILVSAEFALGIERATNGRIPARLLRPDLPWPPLVPGQTAQSEMAVSS